MLVYVQRSEFNIVTLRLESRIAPYKNDLLLLFIHHRMALNEYFNSHYNITIKNKPI